MTYSYEHASYDEFTYQVDCLFIAETGEPAKENHMAAIAHAFDKGMTPWACFDAVHPSNQEAA